MSESQNNLTSLNDLMNAELYPVVFDDIRQKSLFERIPVTDLAFLGTVAADIVNKINSTPACKEIYYKLVTNVGSGNHLDGLAKGKGTVGNIYNSNNELIKRARFVPASTPDATTASPAAAFASNPYVMLAVIAIKIVEKKVDDIKEICQDIMDFLELDKQTKLQADLNTLIDVMNNYKFNTDNKNYKNNKHIQVQEIRREAEHNILFYQENVKKELNAVKVINVDPMVKSQIQKIQKALKYYQLSVYLFAFSSFMEVMLLENFDAGYIKSISDRIAEHSAAYQEGYLNCYNKLNKTSQKSIESIALKGAAGVTGLLGKATQKIHIIADNTKIDDGLLIAESAIGKFNDKKNGWIMENFTTKGESCVQPFLDNLKSLSVLYNEDCDILIGSDGIYYQIESA